jgi:hypothetical protein
VPDSAKQAIFVSYSRNDLGFATQLVYSLRAFGFKVAIDHSELQGGEEWRQRLHQLLVEADSVIFILSPTSAASEVCGWEVDTAISLAKRIIPVLCRPLDGAKPHPHLSALNYIFFYGERASPDSGFGKGLATLVEALSQDVEWLRDHTRLTEIAVRWAAREGTADADDLLLRGSELAAFRAWRARRPASASPLTPVQTRFLDASDAEEQREADEARRQIEAIERAQAERQRALDAADAAQTARERATAKLFRRTVAGIAAAAVLSSLAVAFALLAYQQREVAVAEADKARAAERKALEQESRALAALARTLAEQRLQDRMLQFADNRAPPAEPFGYQTLARRYEGQDADHVSSDFDGTHYYGSFRIKSGANMQEYLGFLARAGPASAFYSALAAAGGAEAARRGDPAFVAAWQAIARDPARGEAFARSQQDFIKRTDYARLRRRLVDPPASGADPSEGGLGLDICARSLALQAAVFSIAVQYGPATPLPIRALAGAPEPAALVDREILLRLYTERDHVERYFPDLGSERYVNLVRMRNRWEMEDALYMLDKAGTPGKCD